MCGVFTMSKWPCVIACPDRRRPTEQGVVLLITLVFLILFALLGLAASRTALLEARLSGQMRAHVQSLAAAELALRECESLLSPFNTALPGMYDVSEWVPTTNLWQSVNWSNPAAVRRVSGTITGMSEPPACIAEQLDATHFRVTVRVAGSAVLFLQSHWHGERIAWAELSDE